MENLNAFMRLTKADASNRMVWGVLAAEVADHAKEIMDFDTAVPAFKSWSAEREQASGGKSLGNIRAQHGNTVAGVLKEISYDPATKSILGKAHIVDENEWNKCEAGAYTGFSIGGAYAKCWADPSDPKLTRYTPILKEISIVDVPCIPVAKFEYVKADGTMEMRKFKAVVEAEEVGVAVQQGWQAKDGTFFKAKQEAIDHNLSVELTKASDTITGALDVLKKAKEALASEAPLEKTAEAEPAKDDEGKIVTEADVKKADEAEDLKKAALAECIKFASDNLNKGLYDIAAVVDVVIALSWLQDDITWNALFNSTETTLPSDLKAIMASLCEFLNKVVADATAGLTAEKAAGLSLHQVEALRKFTGNAELLKDFKPADPALEKSAADTAALTTELEATKAAKGDLEKTVTELTDGIKEMTKGITDLKSANADMAKTNAETLKRLEHLEAQPAMAKGVKYQTLLNGHEGPAATEIPVEVDMRKYNGMSPDEAREQMRKDTKRK